MFLNSFKSPSQKSDSQQAAAQTAHYRSLVEVLRSENEQLKLGLVNIQQNLVQSVELSSINTENCRRIEAMCSELATDSIAIDSETKAFSSAVSEMRHIVESNSDQLASMESLVSMIEEIAAQTRLLALNATIEAARAGEKGKGFAVVANEVKELSSQTENAVDKIRSSIDTITENSSRVSERMRELDDRSSQISDTLSQLSEKVSGTEQMNASSINQIVGTNDSIFMSLAKLDHVIWKVNTYLSVIDQEPAFQFVNHHSCRLGKWYEAGDGFKSFSSMPSYRHLERPHADVHEATEQVFALLEAGLTTDDRSMVNAITQMENGSDGVMECLDKMCREKFSSLGVTIE